MLDETISIKLKNSRSFIDYKDYIKAENKHIVQEIQNNIHLDIRLPNQTIYILHFLIPNNLLPSKN